MLKATFRSIFLLLLTSWMTSLFPVVLQAQEKGLIRITDTVVEKPLQAVLEDWGSRFQLYFTYDPTLLQGYRCTVSLENRPLDQALAALLKGTDLTATIRRRKFVSIKAKARYTYCGMLKDASNGEPVAYASFRGSKEGMTQQDGGFRFETTSRYGQLLIRHLAYEEKVISLTALAQTPCATIFLQPKTRQIETVLIADYLTDGISYEQGAIQLDPDRIAAMPGLTEPDLFRMVQALPGVNAPEESAMNLNIRGGSPDQTLVLYNDIPVYQSGHLFDMISAINPYAIDRASIYRGTYGVDQAGGVSGLIRISQADRLPTQNTYGANFNLTHAGLNAGLVLKPYKAGLHLSLRRSLTDLLPTFTFQRLAQRVFQETSLEERRDDDGILKENDVYTFQDASFRLQLAPTKADRVELSGFVGDNILDFAGEDPADDTQFSDFLSTRNYGASLKWHHDFSERVEQEISSSFSDYRSFYEIEFSDEAGNRLVEKLEKSNGIQDLRWKYLLQFKLNPQIGINAGYEGFWQQTTFSIFNESIWDAFNVNESSIGFTHAFWGALSYVWKKKWYLNLGLRHSYQTALIDWFAAPNVNLHYKARPAVTLKAFASRNHQFVSQFLEFESEGNLSGLDNKIWFVAGEESLPALSANQVGFGLVWQKSGWLFDLELYRKEVSGLNSYSRALSGVNTPGNLLDFTTGTMQAQGVDVLIKKRWQQHSSWLAYSLSQNQYSFPDLQVRPFFTPQDQRHVLSVNHMWALKKWTWAAAWTFRSGRPFTPRSSDIVESQTENNETWYRVSPVLGELSSERLPHYHRLDITALYPLQHRKYPRLQGQIGGSIQNLYNRRNILSIDYFPEYFWQEDFTPDATSLEVEKDLLFFLPNFVLRLNW
ncbi:MAG: TonB-dependent receptor plug domain-containing protein [Bacteroidota bacterium]